MDSPVGDKAVIKIKMSTRQRTRTKTTMMMMMMDLYSDGDEHF